MKNILKFGFVALALAFAVGCSNNNVDQTLDACGCAQESLKDSANTEMVKKCDARRTSDIAFEKDFQKCYVAAKAGVDTSQIHVNKMDTINGLKMNAAANGAYNFDASKSIIKWNAKKVTASHHGTVAVKSASMTIDGDVLKGGEIVIDMPTLVNEDQTGESKSTLETHLKSGDFFDVAKYPEAKFVIKSATQKNKHQYELAGDLTIKGITKPLTAVAIVVPNGDNGVNVSGGFAVDRTQYGIKYGSGQFFKDLGDKMIDDTFIISFDLKGSK